MKRVVFDIETLGEDFEQLDELSKEFFLKFAETDQKVEEVKQSLSFYPLTAQIIALAMLEVDSGKGAVYFQNGQQDPEKFKEGDIIYISGSETEILAHFWNQLKRYEQIVSFNGRVFDCPFIMLRSAINHIQASQNLLPYRYNNNYHIDLADQLTFYDALRRKFSLHMWCRAFGIKSPKENGVTGLKVKEFYRLGQYHTIARYCMDDVIATRKLYEFWVNYIKIS